MANTTDSPIWLSSTLLILTLGGLQAVMPISTDLYLPALPSIARELHVSAGAAQLTLAVFMIGVAVGQMIYGPITDKYGRKKPLLAGLALYILGAVICALALNINTLIAGRFLQALGASASSVITAAIARDLWSGKTLADRLSLLVLVLGVAPLLAPSLGGIILARANWHGLFWFLAAFGALSVVAALLLPETSSPNERLQVRLRDTARTYMALLRTPPFMLFVSIGACMVGTLLAYITGSSFIYIEMLGVSPGLFAIFFGVNALGFIGASQLNRLLLRRFAMLTVIRGAVIVAVLVGLLLLAVVASGRANALLLTALFIAQSATVGATLPNVSALAFGSVRERAGSASALQGTIQSVVSGIAGWLVGVLSNGAALPVMAIITGFAALASLFLVAAYRWQDTAQA